MPPGSGTRFSFARTAAGAVGPGGARGASDTVRGLVSPAWRTHQERIPWGMRSASPRGVRGEDLKLTTALVHVSQGLEGQRRPICSWMRERCEQFTLRPNPTNPAHHAGLGIRPGVVGCDQQPADADGDQYPAAQPEGIPLGLCMPESSQQTFIIESRWPGWTAMVPRMEEPVPTILIRGRPLPGDRVLRRLPSR